MSLFEEQSRHWLTVYLRGDLTMINLTKLNPRYRITLDESWHYERPEVRKADRRWYEQIPCRGGAFISIYSENPPMLQLWTPQIKRPCCSSGLPR